MSRWMNNTYGLSLLFSKNCFRCSVRGYSVRFDLNLCYLVIHVRSLKIKGIIYKLQKISKININAEFLSCLQRNNLFVIRKALFYAALILRSQCLHQPASAAKGRCYRVTFTRNTLLYCRHKW
jgi:hypothetical protein